MSDKPKHPLPDQAIERIASVLGDTKEPMTFGSSADELLFCFAKIAQSRRLKFQKPEKNIEKMWLSQQISVIAQANQWRWRRVSMENQLEYEDSGPLLVFYKTYLKCGVLIPRRNGGFELIIPGENIHRTATQEDLNALCPIGYMFYRGLQEKQVSLVTIIRFLFSNHSADLKRVFIFQSLIALIGLFVPIATGLVMDTVIPNADFSLLQQIFIILLFNTAIIGLFSLSSFISTMRIQLKMTMDMQSAIWDRLLRLPLRFFRGFSAGDLVNRALGITSIQNELTSSALTTAISSLLALFTLALMLYFSVRLTIIALGLSLVIGFLTTGFTLWQLPYLRQSLFLEGKLAGIVLQCINNISKLKISNTLSNAFNYWADLFSEKNRQEYRYRTILMYLTIFTTCFTTLTTIVLFIGVFKYREDISFGNFIAFNAAFSQFFASMFNLIGILPTFLKLIPTYERIKPILETPIELNQSGVEPGELDGKVDFIHVDFRYDKESPVVFKDMTFSVKPGEFVAFAGPSGSGKSSLFRLLLGFEQPDSGKIYISDRELATLDLLAVRQQLGVVLQDSMMHPGSIIENITGYSECIDKERLDFVIKLVQMEEDIKAMPMGIHTLMTEFGKTLSVGQRQRILLARAIYHQPRLLLLDEATSALDNHTQKQIHQALSKMKITRIVAAHRLSTIKDADCIYVIDNGLIQQVGTYDELINQPGLFQTFARQQQYS